MGNSTAYTQEFIEILEELDGDLAGRRAAQSYMEYSTAIVHGNHVSSPYVPKFFDQEAHDTFKHVAETTHSIAVKIMQRYLDDETYRNLFDFDERIAELILLPRGYPDLLPFARIDVFLDEHTGACGFCELNADGSSGLNEDREHNESMSGSAALAEFARRHSLATSELFDSWVDEFLAIYSRYEHAVEHPNIAIVDFLGPGAIVAEFEEYCRRFCKRGHVAFVADVRDLRYDGSHLRTAAGKRIDAVFRRCITSDVLEHWDESQPLIEAVRNEKVALIGSFAGHIPHDKQIFDVMHHPTTQAFLTPEEIRVVNDCVPATKLLDDAHVDLAEIKANKDAWIVKPPDRYGAADVYAGNMCTHDEWAGIIDRFANGAAGAPFIVQTYLAPFKTPFFRPDAELPAKEDDNIDRTLVPMNNMSGLYLFNGRFSGVFSRMGEAPVISEGAGSRYSAATIWVDCDTVGNMIERG